MLISAIPQMPAFHWLCPNVVTGKRSGSSLGTEEAEVDLVGRQTAGWRWCGPGEVVHLGHPFSSLYSSPSSVGFSRSVDPPCEHMDVSGWFCFCLVSILSCSASLLFFIFFSPVFLFFIFSPVSSCSVQQFSYPWTHGKPRRVVSIFHPPSEGQEESLGQLQFWTWANRPGLCLLDRSAGLPYQKEPRFLVEFFYISEYNLHA